MDNETLISAFEGIRRRLLGLAGRMLGNEEDAADAVQDAFCRLWQRRESITSSIEAEGMSVVTVRNLCVDNLRRDKNRPILLEENRAVGESVMEETGEAEEREAVFNEVNAIMEKHLTEVQRTIIRMREYEDRDYEEIANMLNMQPATVRVQLSRARKLVREIYRNRI